MNVSHNPAWVRALLAPSWLLPLARVALVSAFLLGGVTKLMHFQAAVAEQAHFGLHPAWLWAALAIIIELGGSICVISNRLAWLGAGGLGCLTAVAMLVANDFWNLNGAARFAATNSFFEHLGLIAALVIVVWLADVDRAGVGSSGGSDGGPRRRLNANDLLKGNSTS